MHKQKSHAPTLGGFREARHYQLSLCNALMLHLMTGNEHLIYTHICTYDLAIHFEQLHKSFTYQRCCAMVPCKWLPAELKPGIFPLTLPGKTHYCGVALLVSYFALGNFLHASVLCVIHNFLWIFSHVCVAYCILLWCGFS